MAMASFARRIDPAIHDDPTFNIDAFIRDLETMASTITSVMTMDQKELSRSWLENARSQKVARKSSPATAALSGFRSPRYAGRRWFAAA